MTMAAPKRQPLLHLTTPLSNGILPNNILPTRIQKSRQKHKPIFRKMDILYNMFRSTEKFAER